MTEYQLFQYAWKLFGQGYSREAVIRKLIRKCRSRALAEDICDHLLRSADLLGIPGCNSYYN